MPNVKIFVDERVWPEVREGISALLPGLRDMLCSALSVDLAACQFAVIPVLALPDQPRINAELHILPRPERTPEAVRGAAQAVRDRIGGATGQHVAVRIATLDPVTYVALK